MALIAMLVGMRTLFCCVLGQFAVCWVKRPFRCVDLYDDLEQWAGSQSVACANCARAPIGEGASDRVRHSENFVIGCRPVGSGL